MFLDVPPHHVFLCKSATCPWIKGDTVADSGPGRQTLDFIPSNTLLMLSTEQKVFLHTLYTTLQEYIVYFRPFLLKGVEHTLEWTRKLKFLLNHRLHLFLIFILVHLSIIGYLFYHMLSSTRSLDPLPPPCRYDMYNSTKITITAEKEWEEFRIANTMSLERVRKKNIDPAKILILLIIEEDTDISMYIRAISTVDCYRRIHGYSFRMISDKKYKGICPQKDKFFRRHCVAAIILRDYDYMIFLDADAGIVNPSRRIEEFIDDQFDVIMYDRFHNQEVAAGSYIVRNTQFAIDFLNGFADYEFKMKWNSAHGTDNGALHAHLAETILGSSHPALNICKDMWHTGLQTEDLFAYEGCIRNFLGKREEFGKIKITNKFSGWMRDSWLTNSLWNPKMDFILHGWKKQQYWHYKNCDLPIDITLKYPSSNIYPFLGEIETSLCVPGNVTWNHDVNLIVSEEDILAEYRIIDLRVEQNKYALLERIQDILNLRYVEFQADPLLTIGKDFKREEIQSS